MELYYNNTVELNQGDEAQYNGNISAVKWKLDQNATVKGYGYRYDRLNRLLRANYGEAVTTWSNTKYDVTGRNTDPYIKYDLNGNILSMGSRNGTDGANNWLDNFDYRYDGNQLMALGKNGLNAPATNTYTYYPSGNLLRDEFKGFNIYYNELNLPSRVWFGNNNYIDYIYDANGIKHRMEVYIAGTLARATEYAGEFVYINNIFSYMITSEGRVTKPSGYVYEYHLKDHLGNTRVTFEATSNTTYSVSQRADYYPFGQRFNGYTNNDNKYLYNGKELQEGIDSNFDGITDFEFGLYDYGARFYDPQIGRWHSVDPLAEKHPEASTYVYCGNNPLNRTDPDGMDWFQNNQTGDVVYVSSLRQGAEKNMEKGWEWMGGNNMFADKKSSNNDNALLLNNEDLMEGGSYSINTKYNDEGDVDVSFSAYFKGDNAKKFMQGQGFDFNPTQQIRYENEINFYPESGTTITTGSQIYITEKSAYVPKGAIEDQYTPIGKMKYDGFSVVNRFQISYTTNVIKKALDSLMPYIGYHDQRIPKVYPSLKSYPWNNKLINSFLKQK